MVRFAFAGLIALLCVQDDARIKELIRKLDAPELDQREKAVTDLIAAGEAAVPALKEAMSTDSAEVKLRIEEILRGIETAKKSKEVWRDARPVEVKFEDSPIRDILEELSKQSGVRIEAAAVPAEAKASLVCKGTLLEALDRLCTAQDKLTWETKDSDVKMTADRHTAYPAAYSGPFKVHVASIETTRSTNFKEATISFTFGMAALWEPHLKPLKRTKFEFGTCKDDQGREVQAGPFGFEMPGMAAGAGVIIMRAMGGMGGLGQEGERYSLKGLAADAKSVTLSGTARFHFPLDHTPVVFEEVIGGDRKTVGDFAIKVDKVDSVRGAVTFTVTRTTGDPGDLNEEIERRLDSASVSVVDPEKGEHVADAVMPANDRAAMVMGMGGVEAPRSVKLRATFPSLAKKDIKTFKLRFIDRTLEKAARFEVKVTIP